VEFLDGKLVAHRGESLPVPALTNSSYEDSMARLRQRDGGSSGDPGDTGSLDRFAHLSRRMAAYSDQPPIDYAFATLEAVAQGTYTQWSIVYDVGALTIHYRTRSAPDRKLVALSDLDFDCDQPALAIDLSDPLVAGDVRSRLEPYDYELAYELLVPAFHKVGFLKDVPDDAIRELAVYPRSTRCSGHDGS
jgi:hypothetical protein